jgi:hypothetical protein
MSMHCFTLTLVALALAAAPAAADGKTRAAQEAAAFVLQRFGREAARDGASVLARRIERAAVAHGDDVLKAVRLAGPRGLRLIEKGGVHSRQVARLLATHGEKGAVYVASRPQAMQLVLRHGEGAAAALVRSRGVALPAIESLGKPAIGAFQAIGSPQNARRLAMMAAEGGELARIGRTPELLAVIGTWGDAAMSFIWNHKGALAVSAALAAFLAEPQPFITGVRDLSKVVAENVVRPIAEVPAIAAREGAAEIARKTNWNLVFVLVVVVALALLVAVWRFITPAASALLATGKCLLPRRPAPAPSPAAPAPAPVSSTPLT